MSSIPHGKYDDKDLDRELRAIIDAIRELETGSSLASSAVGSTVYISTGGSSGGSSASTMEIRHGVVTLSGVDPATNIILFSSAMSSTAYTIPRLRCWTDSTGVYEDVEAVITNKTINGFTVKVIKACTCEYVALL